MRSINYQIRYYAYYAILYNKYNPQNKSKEALIYEANELKKLAYHNTNELGKIEIDKLEKNLLSKVLWGGIGLGMFLTITIIAIARYFL